MKTEYTFYYDDGLSVEIKNHDRDIDTIYMDDEALDLLKAIDTKTYDHLRVSTDQIEIQNGEVHVIIKDIDKMNKYGLLKKLPHLFPKIKRLIAKAKRQEIKNKKVKKGFFSKKKIKASSFVIAMMSYGMASILNPVDEQLSNNKETANYSNEEDNAAEDMSDLYYKNFNIKVDNDMESLNTFINVNDQTDPQAEAEYQEYLEQVKAPINDEIEPAEGNNYIYPEPVAQEITIEKEAEPVVAFLNYTPDAEATKLQYVKENYHDLINEASKKWGISPNIPEAILTQESGGREKNLMQITFSVWANEPLTVHNFETGKDETFILTNNNNAISTNEVTYITRRDLENPKTNISIGIILIRKSAEYMKFHIGATIQCYNMGIGNMRKILTSAAKGQGKTIEDILSNQQDLSFTKYTHVVKAGDPKYLEHVMRYMENTEGCYIDYFDEFGELLTESVKIVPEEEKEYYSDNEVVAEEETKSGLSK